MWAVEYHWHEVSKQWTLSNMNICQISQQHYLHFEIQPEAVIALTPMYQAIRRSLHGHQHMQPPISILTHNTMKIFINSRTPSAYGMKANSAAEAADPIANMHVSCNSRRLLCNPSSNFP